MCVGGWWGGVVGEFGAGLERAISFFSDEIDRAGSIQTVGPGQFAAVAGKKASGQSTVA